MGNSGGQFRFKVGDKVTITFPTGHVELGRVMDRSTEPALGKTYLIRSQRGRDRGWIPEDYMEAR